jgi:outer membrane receptor protein involved in Fe transport
MLAAASRAYAADREDRNRNEQISGTLRSQLSPRWLGELTFGQALQTRQEPAYLGTGFTPYDSRRTQAIGHLGWADGAGLSLDGTLDAYKEAAGTPSYTGGVDRGEGRHLALDLEGAWEIRSRLRLVGSVHQQWDRQEFLQSRTSAVPEMSARQTTWKLGANLKVSPDWRLYFSTGSAFSLPTLFAVMYNAQNGAAEPLGTEKSRFERLGAGWEKGPWSLRLEASRTRFTQLVYFDMNDWLYANGSRMRLQGLEGSLAYRTSGWGAEGFWRNQEARSQDVPADRQLSAAAVIRRPFNTLGARAWTVLGAWRLEGRWSWTGPRYENFGDRIGAAKTHFNDLAVGLTWAATRDLSLSLRGEHLLQPRVSVEDWKRHATDGRSDAYQVFGFPAQPPTAALEVRYRF